MARRKRKEEVLHQRPFDDPLDDLFRKGKPTNVVPLRPTVGTLEHALIPDAAAALRFMQAGNATVTLKSKLTGNRFTYKVNKSDDGRVWFVKLLVGANNETDYQYIGYVKTSGVYYHGKKSRIQESATSAKAFRWVWQKLASGHYPENLEVWHEGRCGRCNRTLTVPESIATGFGPECAEKMGL